MAAPRARSSLVVAAALALAGCATSAEVRDARSGRVDGLATRVSAAVDRGAFGNGEARDLARAVLDGALDATGDAGLARVKLLSGCVRGAKGALSSRADRRDDVGGEAALVLVEARLASYGGDLSSDEPRWRALAVRGFTSSSDAHERRARMTDGDQEVRLAALRAAGEAADSRDLQTALEAAQVDPYPPAREAAARAAGAIGGERAVLGLKDLWPRADDGVRRAIAEGWYQPASIEEGGRRELQWAAEHERGGASIVAAYLLARAGGDDATAGVYALERAITSGPTEDRIFAELLAPWSAEPIRAAIRKASADTDDAVAIASLGRRLREGDDDARATVRVKLLAYASGPSRWARQARLALAEAKVAAVHPLLLRELRSPDAAAREAAGVALADLGDLPHAAIVAADANADVRLRVACAVLAR
jgi:HEAT repeat protein